MKTIHHTVGLLVQLLRPLPRDERGLSPSTENAILLAGAALIAGIIIKVITDYVSDKLPT